MGLWRRLATFAMRETAGPLFGKVGEHLGDAIGTVLGRRIDPEHCREPQSEDDDVPGKDR